MTSLVASVAAISAKTTNLPASPAAVGSAMNLTADYNAAKTAAQASALATVDTVVDAIKAVTDNLATSAATLVNATVDTTAFAATTTEFEADDITTPAADHYNGRLITFTSGPLANQQTDIVDYALVGGRGHFTVTALTSAPGNDVTFVIQ